MSFNIEVDHVAYSPRKTETVPVDELTDITEEQKIRLNSFLEEELKLFEDVKGPTDLIVHEIKPKKGVPPIKQRDYPRNPARQNVIKSEVETMLKDGIIEHSTSGWNSPVVLIKKPTGKYRFCIDFRKVNDCTEKFAYPAPRISAILDKLRGARYITTLDLANGYWQVPLAEGSREMTAFAVPGLGLFQFKVMPFGLHSASATFQKLLDKIVGPEMEPYAFAYLDDLVLISTTFEVHLNIINEVLARLRKAKFKLNIEKCCFCRTELKYLGHIINANGVGTDPEKVKAILQFPRPTGVKSLRSFLGLASWYRRFVDKFASLTAPLTSLLKKTNRWKWTEAQENAFNELKRRLTSTPVLACPDFKETFILQVDASDVGLGAALTQKIRGKEVVICYLSRLLSESEKKFTVTEKECLALVWAIKKLRPYLEGYHFVAVTDHVALKWLLRLKEPTGRLARWVLEIQQHDFEISYRKGVKNTVPDFLSRHPIGRAEETEIENAVCPLEAETTETNEINYPDLNTESRSDKWYYQLWTKVRKDPEKFCAKYLIREDKLFRVTKTRRSERDSNCTEDYWKMCVPRHKREEVLNEVHSSTTAGHLGFKKTSKRLASDYYWPGWRQDVKKYVKHCPVCQRYKVEQIKPAGKMHFRPPVGPWHTVSADILGPLPRSKKGNKYVIAFQDQFSKWTEIAPLKEATAIQVMVKFKELVLMRYGAPDVLITDNGTQFSAKIFRDMAKDWEINCQPTAPYSPQSNPIERRNRVIKTLIAQCTKGKHQRWDENLIEIAYAINTATHDSTGYTPAMLCYGRELKVPRAIRGPLFVTSSSEIIPTVDETHGKRLEQLRKLYAVTQNNLKEAFKRQAKVYNLRRRDVEYTEGQQVLKRTHILSSANEFIAGKLAPKYEGPFVVIKKRGYNLYELSDKSSGKKSTAHVKDLKPYYEQL